LGQGKQAESDAMPKNALVVPAGQKLAFASKVTVTMPLSLILRLFTTTPVGVAEFFGQK
jgi:hypothetical protein